MNVLLAHSHQNQGDSYYYSYVRPATAEELSRKTVDGDGFPLEPVLWANKKEKTVFVYNPILTDVTQEVHTDIHQILRQNPDVSGLSLIVDDASTEELRQMVSIQDFLPPSQYVDVFDIAEYVEHAKRQFSYLPASLRKAYNNDPMELGRRLASNDPKAYASLQQYLGIDATSISLGQASGQSDVQSSQSSPTPDAPDIESDKKKK